MIDATYDVMGSWKGCFEDEWKFVGKITFKNGDVDIASSGLYWTLKNCPRTEVLRRWWGKEEQTGFEFIKGKLINNILEAETHNVDDASFIRWWYHTFTFDFNLNSFQGKSKTIPGKLASDEENETGEHRGIITSVNGVAIELE